MQKTNKISQKYNASTIHNIYEIYQKNDSNKLNKWITARRIMDSLEGWGLRIIDYNKFNYSCAFVYEDHTKKLKLYYFTLSNTEQICNYYKR